uniref:Uncharacterized protein n=1 Tax=Arundo donax TaxID=35708 RepID=A0A0A8Y965_ARUDO
MQSCKAGDSLNLYHVKLVTV